MTRSTIQANARQFLMSGYGSLLRQYAGPSEDNLLDRAADETAQRTDCYWSEEITDLVGAQQNYCAPKIYKPKLFYAVDSSGNRQRLTRLTTRQMERRYPCWRQDAAADIPVFVVSDGLGGSFAVSPVALADRDDALIVVGFAVSTLPKAGRDTHQWDLPGDECPLPVWAHDAVQDRYISLRLLQLASADKSALALSQAYERNWRSRCGQLEAQAAAAYRSMRAAVESNGDGWR